MNKKDRLIVALDVPSLKEAEALVKTLSGSVHIFKIGKELFTSAGPEAVKMVHRHGAKVFLDLKFHDIPNTVAQALRAASNLNVFMVNVHCLGGRVMMQKAAEAVKASCKNPPLLLGVTVLTSLAENDLKQVGIQKKIKDEVSALAKLAKKSGLDGVVASAQEIRLIRKACGKDFLIVTPGVRPAWAAVGDQKRIMTPREAIQAGSDFIVIGRPITQHSDPLAAARRILDETNH